MSHPPTETDFHIVNKPGRYMKNATTVKSIIEPPPNLPPSRPLFFHSKLDISKIFAFLVINIIPPNLCLTSGGPLKILQYATWYELLQALKDWQMTETHTQINFLVPNPKAGGNYQTTALATKRVITKSVVQNVWPYPIWARVKCQKEEAIDGINLDTSCWGKSMKASGGRSFICLERGCSVLFFF